MRWTRCYTAGLAPDVRERRLVEIGSDVYEQLADRGADAGARREVLWRTARGMADDVTWRIREGRRMQAPGHASLWRVLWATMTQAWFSPIAVLVGAFDLLMAIGVLTDANSTMPGRAIGPTVLTAFAVSTFVGLHLRSRTSRSPHISSARTRSRITTPVVVIGGLLAVVVLWGGGAGYVPVFVVVGLAIVVAAYAMLRRRGRGRSYAAPRTQTTADVLLVLGSLPGLGLFWMIVPPILALAVIAGVLGVGQRRRAATV